MILIVAKYKKKTNQILNQITMHSFICADLLWFILNWGPHFLFIFFDEDNAQ